MRSYQKVRSLSRDFAGSQGKPSPGGVEDGAEGSERTGNKGRKARADWRRAASRYAPVLVWMGGIFFASGSSLSASNTSRIVRPLLLWLSPGMTEEGLQYAHLLVRKAAHFTEYFVLASLAARAFLMSESDAVRRRWFFSSLVLVAVCALSDEYHQSFLASRTGTIYDSLLDMSGGATALLLVGAWLRLRGQRRGAAGGGKPPQVGRA